jgi:hypothetical protein
MHHAKSVADFDKLHANESACKYKQSLCCAKANYTHDINNQTNNPDFS